MMQQAPMVSGPTIPVESETASQSNDALSPQQKPQPAYDLLVADLTQPQSNALPADGHASPLPSAPLQPTCQAQPAHASSSQPPLPATGANINPASTPSKTLTAYIIPFPKPTFQKGLPYDPAVKTIPSRFLVYTPPAPPLIAPKDGEKEARLHKAQRKWQSEVEAKTHKAKLNSWRDVKGRATKGVDWGMRRVTNSNLDFLNRVPTSSHSSSRNSTDAHQHAKSAAHKKPSTSKTAPLEELFLLYPADMPGTPTSIRAEFINTLLRTKSKAQRDTIIATGLLPIGLAIDLLIMFFWPFGGVAEIDAVWGVASAKGARTARAVTKRLGDGGVDVDGEVEVDAEVKPTEEDVLQAVGWCPSQTRGENEDWEDVQWGIREVKEDIRDTMRKGAREWVRWCKGLEKDPEKALNKA